LNNRRTVVGGVVLALALGDLAAALPAQAAQAAQASTVNIGCPIFTVCVPVTWVPTVTDSLNPGGVTEPDAILTCATSQITISGIFDLAIPVGCLTLYNGEWVKVTWTSPEQVLSSQTVTMELSQQTDGNLVLTAGTDNGANTREWSAGTTFAGNPSGPGCSAQFQSTADLVVDNCDGTTIWDSGASSDSSAILAFQNGGNLEIDQSSAGTALWSSQTSFTSPIHAVLP
jgi:hypothetical protein